MIQDCYLQYEAASDQKKSVAGLPIEKKEFSILPPQFTNREVASSSGGKNLPFLRKNLCSVCEMALASFIYQCD